MACNLTCRQFQGLAAGALFCPPQWPSQPLEDLSLIKQNCFFLLLQKPTLLGGRLEKQVFFAKAPRWFRFSPAPMGLLEEASSSGVLYFPVGSDGEDFCDAPSDPFVVIHEDPESPAGEMTSLGPPSRAAELGLPQTLGTPSTSLPTIMHINFLRLLSSNPQR